MGHEMKVGVGFQNHYPTITRSGRITDTVNTQVEGRPAKVTVEQATKDRFVQQTQGVGLEGTVELGLNGQWALIGGVRLGAGRASFLARSGEKNETTPYTLLNAAPQVGARYFISPTDKNASIAALASFDVSGISYKQNGSAKQNVSTLALGLGMEVAVKPFNWLEVALQVGSATPLSNFSPGNAEGRAGIVIRVPIFEFGGTSEATIQVDAQTATDVKEAEENTEVPTKSAAPAEASKEVAPTAAPAAPAEETPPAGAPPAEEAPAEKKKGEDAKEKKAPTPPPKKDPKAAKREKGTKGGANAILGGDLKE